MTRIYIILFTAAMALVSLSACSGSQAVDPEDSITEIEILFDTGDIPAARSLADELANDSTLTLSATQLCRLSIVYMKMSDITETDINTALATRCYRMAMIAGSDSATAYYESLPLDESRHVDLMSKLEPMLSIDRNIYLDEDSIADVADFEPTDLPADE